MSLFNRNAKLPTRRDRPQGWLSDIRRKAAQEETMADDQANQDEATAEPSEDLHTELVTKSTHPLEPEMDTCSRKSVEVVREEQVAPSTSSGPQGSNTGRKSIMKRITGKLQLSSGDFQPRNETPSKKPYQELAHLGDENPNASSVTSSPSQRRRVTIQEPKKAYKGLTNLSDEDQAAGTEAPNLSKRRHVPNEKPKKGVEGKKTKKEQTQPKKPSMSQQPVPEASKGASSQAKTVKLEELPGFESLSTDPYIINYDDPPEDQQWKMDNLLQIVRNDRYRPAFTWEYRQGSVFDAKEEHVLVHSCNCQGFWGKGFALELRHKFPQHYKAYRDYCNERKDKVEDMLGDMLLLGPHNVDTSDEQLIACLFTRETASKAQGPQDQRRTVDYTDVALNLLQHELTQIERTDVTDIVMPKINGGLFGVPWEQTEQVLRQAEVVERYPTRRIIVYDGKKHGGKGKGKPR
ncbi:MAG: ADP-ribose 1''-phosphate phosphatase [Alyxoria varia]|nr:MAG: ADP-ribose 1''-phosphate phosphatase [Alyxoria varia]